MRRAIDDLKEMTALHDEFRAKNEAFHFRMIQWKGLSYQKRMVYGSGG